MSIVSYNGIILPYANTTSFKQEAVMDDVSGTDWCYTKYDIQIQCVINTQYLPTIIPVYQDIPAGPGVTNFDNPAKIMVYVRNQLLKPRKHLSMRFNNTELIPQSFDFNAPADADGLQPLLRGTVDAKNGPLPQSCVYNQLTNTTFLLTYHIIANYWETGTVTGNANQLNPPPGGGIFTPPVEQTGNCVLFNRWSETMDIDNANYTTRTRDGKFVIRSDNDSGIIADQLRSQMAVVGVPPGFVRNSSKYTVDPSGLGISYTIIDREVYRLPPYPAFEAQGEYTETVGMLGIYPRFAEVHLVLKGGGNTATSQGRLLQAALDICTAKLKANGAPINNIGGNINHQGEIDESQAASFLTDGSIKVSMYENKVEVFMRAMKILAYSTAPFDQIPPNRIDGISFPEGINIKAMTNTPADPWPPNQGSTNNPGQPNYKDYGNAGRILHAAAYYDPALRNAFLNKSAGQNIQVPQGNEPGEGGTKA